ncbi:MAG: sulfatase-like hydrolase/transferase, partial [Chloroflexi bacterium]|nr:sulfatase-like hydrolase/transferase [Chloroflexota bacterium]
PPAPFSRMFYAGDEKDPNNRSMDPVFAFESFALYFQQWMGGVTDIRFPCAQYDAEIAYGDTALAHVFNRLDELGLSDSTLVIVTSDHGEELDEHGCWFDHHGLYETNVHVPLLMRLPGTIPAGRRLSGFATLMDIAPTILEATGAGRLAEAERMEGQSLWPLVTGGTGETRRRVARDELYFTECTWMRKRAWRTPEWKLIQALEPDFHNMPPLELYNMIGDPEETNNVADARPDVVQDLLERMERHAATRLAQTALPDPLQTQSITLRKIGELKTAVPENQKLEAEAKDE